MNYVTTKSSGCEIIVMSDEVGDHRSTLVYSKRSRYVHASSRHHDTTHQGCIPEDRTKEKNTSRASNISYRRDVLVQQKFGASPREPETGDTF